MSHCGSSALLKSRRWPISDHDVFQSSGGFFVVWWRMDRAMLQKHLAIAERHIAQGVKLLAKQEALIAELARHNHDTEGARAVLATMRETQTLHIDDRDRISRALEQ